MKISRRQATIGSMSLLAGTSMSTMTRAQLGEGLRDLGEGLDDFVVARDAYIYGYPLVTMEMTRYEGNYFFVANPINRYSISARQNLKSNPDGSVDLHIQKDSPGADQESNWLPAPAGKFILMLRLYWPNDKDPSILDGSWKIPAVKKIS
jgi:hypothetical protein